VQSENVTEQRADLLDDGGVVDEGLESRLHLTKVVQGWPKLRDLAQHFDVKSLLQP
jgi:hypothetical protein